MKLPWIKLKENNFPKQREKVFVWDKKEGGKEAMWIGSTFVSPDGWGLGGVTHYMRIKSPIS